MNSSTPDYVADLTLAVDLSGIDVPEIVAPSNRHVLLNAMRFHYLDWGGTGTTPIVFLHGGGLTAHTWDLVCLAMRDRYRCHALDLRGHGDSEWSRSAEYGVGPSTVDLELFVRELRLGSPVVVGMSFGGQVAVSYAVSHPVRALVIVDTGPVIEMAGADRINRFLRGPSVVASVEDFVEQAMEHNPRRDPRLLRRSLLHNLVQLPDGAWTWKNDRRHYEHRAPGGKEAATRRAIWQSVDSLDVPTLLVRGADSDVLMRSEARALAVRLRKGRLVEIAGAGHTVQGDSPKAFAAELSCFLDDALS